MKYSRIILTFTFVFMALVSCREEQQRTLPFSQGASYEVVIVTSESNWNGGLGDTITEIMQELMPVFNVAVPVYSVSRVSPNNYTSILKRHRNLIIIDTGHKYEEPRMYAQYDVNATPQIIVNLVGPDTQSLTQYVSDHRTELQTVFEIAERDRSVAMNTRTQSKTYAGEVRDRFGFDMLIPNEYSYAKANSRKDFVWFRKHYKMDDEQGFVVYSYPYSGRENFTADSLVARRDEFVSRIEGGNPGSHMRTSPEFEPVVSHKRINGRYWAEMRGFWDMKSDYFGGPFVSYSTLDTETNRVITIDMYVYAPNAAKNKRNYYRQLQHLVYGVSFPGDKAAE